MRVPAVAALITLALAFGFLPTAPAAGAAVLPSASWTNLPAWRGFNLLNKFSRDGLNGPYREADFRFIAEHGFNFVRLPIDYRTYLDNGDWERFRESALREIDAAVGWGGIHGVHVCLNLHRVPGWTVASPAEAKSLWTDPEAQRVAARHWGQFARRYRGIPNDRLSFNLLNEPPDITPAAYSNVVATLAAAIRAEDPERLILCDGLSYASRPVPELIPLRVAQATRGYTPFGLTHYRASWVAGSDGWPRPTWPGSLVNGYLYGPQKAEFRSALRIEGPFPTNTTLRIRVLQVSARSRLVVRAGSTVVTNKLFQPGPGTGEWREVIFQPQWNVYQNVYDRDYAMTVPAGAPWVTLENTDGDWMTFAEIGLTPQSPPGAPETVVPAANRDWGRRQSIVVRYQPAASPAVTYSESEDGAWLWRETIRPWLDLRARGVGVMVGEWGAHNQTPHPVVLAWMRAMLDNFENAGLGWALWNLDGSFGPSNSDRSGVAYESYQGRRLDRAMFDLLREYTGRREAFRSWRDRVLPSGNLPESARGPEADPAGSGVANLVRYAFASDGTGMDPDAWPSLVRVANPAGSPGVELRYRQSRRETGIRFRALATDDWVRWTEVPLEPTTLGATTDYEVRAVRLPMDRTRQVWRLEVLAPPM